MQSLLTLACFGNHRLRTGSSDTALAHSPVFEGKFKVGFYDDDPLDLRKRPKAFTSSPLDWLERIAQEGAVSLRLHYLATVWGGMEDWESTAWQGGGGIWVLGAEFRDRRIDLWRERSHPSIQTVWRVKADTRPKSTRFDPARLTASLQSSVLAALGFWRAHGGSGSVAGDLDEASRLLEEGSVPPPCWQAPAGALSPSGATLLAAATKSWVFGGMGSWSDLTLRDSREIYERLSADLWRAIVESYLFVSSPEAQAT